MVPNFFHLWMMEATVLFRTFNAAKINSVPFPRSVPALPWLPAPPWLPVPPLLHLPPGLWSVKEHLEAAS